MKRIAILIDKNQSTGSCANISAILMGELSATEKTIFTNDVQDKDNCRHSSIHHSTIILKVNSSQQIINLIEKVNSKDVYFAIFSKIGQGLHNQFDEYKLAVKNSTSTESEPVGIILYGDDITVRSLVKKYSVLQ